MMPHTLLPFHEKKRGGTWLCVVNEPLFSGNYVIVCLRIHYNIGIKWELFLLYPHAVGLSIYKTGSPFFDKIAQIFVALSVNLSDFPVKRFSRRRSIRKSKKHRANIAFARRFLPIISG